MGCGVGPQKDLWVEEGGRGLAITQHNRAIWVLLTGSPPQKGLGGSELQDPQGRDPEGAIESGTD